VFPAGTSFVEVVALVGAVLGVPDEDSDDGSAQVCLAFRERIARAGLGIKHRNSSILDRAISTVLLSVV
jgi:hypothetical protein